MTDGPRAGTVPSRNVAVIESLVSTYAEPVYRIAHGLTGSAADAEEVLRRVFMQAVRDVDLLDGPAGIRTWMYRLATRAALRRRRRRASPPGGSADAWLPQFTADGHRAGDRGFLLADWSRLPDEALRAPLQDLADQDHAVLILVDGERLSAEEAADVLEESPATLRSRLHAARMVLRERITRAHVSAV